MRMPKANKKVIAHLFNIFLEVADACDGGECSSTGVLEAYDQALKDEDFGKFYDACVKARSEEVFGD